MTPKLDPATPVDALPLSAATRRRLKALRIETLGQLGHETTPDLQLIFGPRSQEVLSEIGAALRSAGSRIPTSVRHVDVHIRHLRDFLGEADQLLFSPIRLGRLYREGIKTVGDFIAAPKAQIAQLCHISETEAARLKRDAK